MKLETIAVHSGYECEATTRAAVTPIYQTASYTFRDTQHGADLFDLKEVGNIYTRIMNPTTDVLEKRIAAMEGGVGALALSSGMAAITDAILTITSSGDNIISTSQLYGGTYNLFAHTLPRLGIEVRFTEDEKITDLVDDKTKLVFCESLGNPAGNVCDLVTLADNCHQCGIVLVVDNTVPTPCLCRPFEHGADIVVHSLTKYIGGHGNSIGGIIVDSGRFPWTEHADRYSVLIEPDPSYHGVSYTETMGTAAYIARARVVPLRNMGGALSPQNSFYFLQGLETMPLRVERHCANALAVARYLQSHAGVQWVNYAGLDDHPDKALVDSYLSGKASGILSFGIKGGSAAGAKFIDALQLILRLVNIGDVRSLACHPATTTHRQLTNDELKRAGVSADLVRLSIGIEHIDDILEDIEQALAKTA
ncbi:MAG: aminotransferase class I/II-fold pyridoxal phosphate-dependent enzyme [Chromatiales bacterium]|nr:aminotransferase class I/II-fold pyridoxal phosphate-dependent enzyme [Chromatiales bacterium]